MSVTDIYFVLYSNTECVLDSFVAIVKYNAILSTNPDGRKPDRFLYFHQLCVGTYSLRLVNLCHHYE